MKRIKSNSFTLIELLVVITILFILAALLGPSLRAARMSAKDIQCGQNMRQIHMSIVMYVQDHNNRYFDAINFDTQYLQLGYLSNIITRYDFFRCPLSNGDIGPDELTWPWWSTTINGKTEWTEYKVNDHGDLLGQDFGSQLRPQKMVVIIDGVDWNPRHRGKNNLCFFDGHVEAMTWGEYNGPEPGRSSPALWFRWGIEN
jgi:prepilin-type processing-associated H-X9-DG protein